ncbi:Gfo/Idh/MocA family protein [Nocardioides sp.]|uniref:Gfo/Idh/MocA family protein n=1 Tax=Nocardioides sp. TaxID=35761 RepID=UPI0027355BAA|nr:Gfo/Idh/MocA family oxidoreductase [Nocardioides sp.]MDP3891875.1 Gfo/Idh/MocA family oxidoreductase [Nocardioides sp.]
MNNTVRWGILAPGTIARAFAADLRLVPGSRLVAVGSRRQESARAFADEYAGSDCSAYGSYAELVADPTVDVVYVASPHTFHLEHARLAIEAGKHVLCEKPVTLDLAAAEELVRLARRHDRFLMEAMWMACHPLVREIRRRLLAGDLGAPRQVTADFGFHVDLPPSHRLLDPALGGGALLDVGIYPLTFAHLMLGEPEELTAVAHLAPTGVDLDIAVAGRYPGGATAALTASLTAWSSQAATIATDTGRVDLPSPFYSPGSATWTPYGTGSVGTPRSIVAPDPVIGLGYGNEAAEVARCLREGMTESPLVPHTQTLAVMAQLDRLRRQVGVRYAGEA